MEEKTDTQTEKTQYKQTEMTHKQLEMTQRKTTTNTTHNTKPHAKTTYINSARKTHTTEQKERTN